MKAGFTPPLNPARPKMKMPVALLKEVVRKRFYNGPIMRECCPRHFTLIG
jgi:hypothetical protein